MNIISNAIFLDHDTGNHPENRKRLEAFGELPETEIPDGSEYLPLVHPPEYVRKVKEACAASRPLDPDTLTSPGSFAAAVAAVGAAVLASETNGFALVRPPGHHAFPDRGTGFCLFNNMAIAAQKLVNAGKKVLIFDFDGHLGDGTESIFYRSDTVLYISFHQAEAFPGGGTIGQIGEGSGKGFTVNLPLAAGSGDDIYFQALDTLLPVVEQFAPDRIGFSAGFDAYRHDPLLRLRLSLNAYHGIGKRFSDLRDRAFAVLEGGYDTGALPKCVNNFIAGIDGKSVPHAEEPTDTVFLELEDFTVKMNRLKEVLLPYWKL